MMITAGDVPAPCASDTLPRIVLDVAYGAPSDEAEGRAAEVLSVLNDVFDSLCPPTESGVWHLAHPA